MKKTKFQKIQPYLYLLPILAVLVTFKYIPFFMALQKSFFNWNGTNIDEFIGLENYIKILQDSTFITSLQHSFVVMIAYVVIAITVPLIAAELVFGLKSQQAQYVTRTLFTFPMVVPGLVVILLWKWILAGDDGILNIILNAVGLSSLAQPWLSQSSTALGAIIAIGFPWLGMSMIGGMQFLIYFATLQGIPREIFESATIDGANVFHRFWRMDLPLLSGQMRLMITLAIINGLQLFDSVKVLTDGGPGISTMLPTVYIYQQAFQYKKMGYSSAMGIVLFAIIMVLTVINNTVIKSKEEVEY